MDNSEPIRIIGGRVHLPAIYAASSYDRREKGRADKPDNHRHEHPSHLASDRDRFVKQGIVHDNLGDHGFYREHEYQKHNSNENPPGRTEDKVARSTASGTSESEGTSVDLPKQIACETKLEGPNISLDTSRMR